MNNQKAIHCYSKDKIVRTLSGTLPLSYIASENLEQYDWYEYVEEEVETTISFIPKFMRSK